jgi:tetratricopeptide (TPR) repeat protein
MDLPHVARLQLLVCDARLALRERFPTLPHGSKVSHYYLPEWTLHAFAGHRAFQLWYRDTTLRWISFEEFQARPEIEVAAFLEYEPRARREIALVESGAMRRYLAAVQAIRLEDYEAAAAELARADALQRGRDAIVFLGSVSGTRALCLLRLGRREEAWREGLRSVALWHASPDGRYAVACLELARGRIAEAAAQCDTMLWLAPDDERAQKLRAQILSARQGRGGPDRR